MGQAYPRKGLCGEGSVAPRGAPTAAGCPSHGWFATLFVGTAPEAERACSGGGVEALSTPYARGGVQYNMRRGFVLTEILLNIWAVGSPVDTFGLDTMRRRPGLSLFMVRADTIAPTACFRDVFCVAVARRTTRRRSLKVA